MSSFDEAYRAAQRAAREQRPAPQPVDPNTQWVQLARRIDREIISRFLRSARTRQARRCGEGHGDGIFFGKAWYEWNEGSVLPIVGRNFRIDSRGHWKIVCYLGDRSMQYDQAYSFERTAAGGFLGEAGSACTTDGVFNQVQQLVAGYMARNHIPLK